MQNRFVAGLTLACLIAIAFAASAVAVDISRTSEPPLTEESNMTPAGPGVLGLRVMPGSAPPVYSCDPTGNLSQLTLWAGQHYDVGTVFVETYDHADGKALRVIYDLTAGDWHLTEYHLYVGAVNPPKSAPGRFPYGGEGFDTQYLKVDHELLGEPIFYDDYKNADGCVILAAHAVVQTVVSDDFDLDDFADMLPECAPITVNPEPLDGEAYFGVDVLDTILAGNDYDGWCIDPQTVIPNPRNYDAEVYSSYTPEGWAWVDMPENLDLVNWILNQDFVGKASLPVCSGDFTYGDVQLAMWMLVDGGPFSDAAFRSLGTYSECRADQILQASMIYGEGYEPTCGDVVGVILVPYDGLCGEGTPRQILIIPVEPECNVEYGDETAWAKDYDSDDDCDFRTGWGSYFQFCD